MILPQMLIVARANFVYTFLWHIEFGGLFLKQKIGKTVFQSGNKVWWVYVRSELVYTYYGTLKRQRKENFKNSNRNLLMWQEN